MQKYLERENFKNDFFIYGVVISGNFKIDYAKLDVYEIKKIKDACIRVLYFFEYQNNALTVAIKWVKFLLDKEFI